MTVIFTDTLNSSDNANDGFSIRNVVALTGGAQGQVRATFQASSSQSFHTDHCSIGISTGTNANTTATPIELKFAGASGFNITSGTTITSDWVNLSGFTSSDKLVVIFDCNSGANSGNFEDNLSSANCTNWFQAATVSWNVAAPAGFTSQATTNLSLKSVEVQAVPGGATTIGWSRPNDPERPLPPPQRTDWASQWFVRSPNPVPQRWLPITGQEDRPPLPSRFRPDDSSIENPQATFFRPSQIPVPQRWLPITGQEDRPPPPRIRPDDSSSENPQTTFFRPSQIPVPQRWMPTTGQEDRPAPFRPDDSTVESAQFFRPTFRTTPSTWFATGQEDRPPNPNRTRSPDESYQSFVRSPVPVPNTWIPQWDGWER